MSASNPGTLYPESFREIIGTFSQVITIQRELGSKRGAPAAEERGHGCLQ